MFNKARRHNESGQLVYFTDGSTVFRRSLDGTLPGSLSDTVNTGGFLTNILGLDVMPDGDAQGSSWIEYSAATLNFYDYAQGG